MISLQKVSAEEFDKTALKHPKGNFLQTSSMALLRTRLGWDVHMIIVKDSNKILGAFLLSGKKGKYEVSRGPLLDFNNKKITEILNLVTLYVKNIGGYMVQIYPYEIYQVHKSNGQVAKGPDLRVLNTFKNNGWKHNGFSVEYNHLEIRWVFVKDLSLIKNEQQLLASYRQTTRQIIKKLNPSNYSVKKLGYNDLKIAKELIDSSNQKNHATSRNLDYYQKLYKSFGNQVEFMVVYYDNKTPIASGIFIHHPNELVYFMSGVDTNYRELYGSHYLQHYMLNKAVNQKIARYNFYGLSGNFTKNPLLTFKSGFRGEVEEYIGGFTFVTNKAKYFANHLIELLKKIVKKLLPS